MLKDTELDELARAVAALGDEDAGRLDEAVRERRRAKAEVKAMCEKLLANTVIESYRIDVA